MKTLCKGKSKRVAFLAFLNFVFSKACDVTFYRCADDSGLFVAKSPGCKNRVFCNISFMTARIIYLVSVGQCKNYTVVEVSYKEYCEIKKNTNHEDY